ncbi:hypothetical protein [Pedobacter caeni]|uniref:Lipocalin-like domain-containing protein n=1 Tax=Pedobacter caeni TaxID=288992 RepID=A0A1M4TB63_9SPHI|nr:hypothetical protein [Pedobacter caeni]SHE41693.1 hypothetical protein SAMN04488522_101141 [Pedobacter caeni]
MKAIFYSLMAILLFSSATCRKVQSGSPLDKQLIGAWKYTKKSGGYAGKSENADPAMNLILEFKSGFKYIKKTNGQVSEQGSYELYQTKSIYSGKEDHAIRFSSTSDHPDKNSIISLRNDTLILADNVYDGFSVEYIRIK